MDDTSGNSVDQPVPTGPSSPEPVAPPAGDASNPPAPDFQSQGWEPPAAPPAPDFQSQGWAPPAAPSPAPDFQSQGWAPPAAPSPAPDFQSQGWEPPAAPDFQSQGWAPPASPTPPPASQPWGQQPGWLGQPPAAASGGHTLIWAVICGLLVVVLIGVSAYSFMTISSTNKSLDDTKASLASEQAARKSAEVHATAVTSCVSAMKTDETALQSLNTDLATLQARAAAGGDIDAARQAYESKVSQAIGDFSKGSLAMNHATTDAEYNASVTVLMQADAEMKQAATLKITYDGLVSNYDQSVQSETSQIATLQAQMAQTATQCGVSAA